MNAEEEKLAKTIGLAIARLRLEKKLTQQQMAEKLGIGNEAVSRLERGVVTPTVTRLIQLATILECDVGDLLNEVSTRASDQEQYVNRLLDGLNEQDRRVVIEVTEKLVHHLTRAAKTQ